MFQNQPQDRTAMNRDMSREQETNRQVGGLLLMGFCLFCLAFFAPDVAPHRTGAFFKIASAASWHRLFEWPSAWCSLKIILSSIGLFLVVESLGTLVVRSQYKDWAVTVFSLQIISLFGFLSGDYYLLKALF